MMSNMVDNGNRQKVVLQKDIEKHLRQDWEFVSVIEKE